MKTKWIAIALLLLGTGCSKTDFSSQKANSESANSNSTTRPDPQLDRKRNQAESDCQYFRLGLGFLASPLADGATVDNLVGSGIFSAGRVARIRAITGSVILLTSSSGAKVDLVENVEGSVLACGLDLTAVRNVAGSVITVDGNIGSVDQVTGSVLAIGGQVAGPVQNSTGSVLSFY